MVIVLVQRTRSQRRNRGREHRYTTAQVGPVKEVVKMKNAANIESKTGYKQIVFSFSIFRFQQFPRLRERVCIQPHLSCSPVGSDCQRLKRQPTMQQRRESCHVVALLGGRPLVFSMSMSDRTVAESTAAGFRVIEPGVVGRRAPSHQLEVLRGICGRQNEP